MYKTTLRLGAAFALPLLFAACSDSDMPTALSTESTTVATPSADADDVPDAPTIVELARESGEFNILLAALEAAGLDDVLNGTRPYTVFAPTDAAFTALEAQNEGILGTLLDPANVDQLRNILLYHVTRGKRSSPSVVGAQWILMLNEERVDVTTNAVGAFVNDAQIVDVDLEAANGIVHVIDAVLVPQGGNTRR